MAIACGMALAGAAGQCRTGGVAPPVAPDPDDEVAFTAATLDYDENSRIVVATGDVVATRGGQRLRADRVTWNRETGRMHAQGNVVLVSANGDHSYGSDVDLTDDMKDGIAQDLLVVLSTGGRIAATSGTRVDGVTTADHAQYSPCAVVDGDGCPKTPLWSITADRIVHDPARHRLYYRNAQLRFFHRPIVWLPRLSNPDGSGEGDQSGLLVPQTGYTKQTGFSVALPIYLDRAPDRDLTITPTLYTDALPMVAGTYRALTARGAYQASLYVTGDSATAGNATTPANGAFRGYVTANGRVQLDPYWTLDASLRAVTDKTFLRRYQINGDDRLRSTISADRADADSYLSIAGWVTQSLLVGRTGGQQPIALPVIDYRRRLDDPWLGGRIELEANSLGIVRTEGQDTQRAFAGVRWDLRRLTALGQQLTLTALARGDVYHTSDIASTPIATYRGQAGWSTRGIAAAAADLSWPFVGSFAGGTQLIAPRVQLVLTPHTPNLAIPDEDARAVDLETTNLFAINRFSGYDRWEDSSRLTYGLDWRYDRPRFAASAEIGQSYRLDGRGDTFLTGTGLSGRFSDIVARATIKYADLVSLTERLRVDKDSLAVRRNEVDLTVGSRADYVTVAYFKLNRNIDITATDLGDHEDLRLSGRLQVARHWSVYGSTIIDLTGTANAPLPSAGGFEPVRQRIGVEFLDECFRASLAFQRNSDTTGAASGSAVLFSIALRNLGS